MGLGVRSEMIGLGAGIRKNVLRLNPDHLSRSPVDSPISPTGSSRAAGEGKKLAPWVSTSSGFSVAEHKAGLGMIAAGGVGLRRPDEVEVRRIGM